MIMDFSQRGNGGRPPGGFRGSPRVAVGVERAFVLQIAITLRVCGSRYEDRQAGIAMDY